MHNLILIAISIFFLQKATNISAQTCYFPDGSVSSRDIPCRAPTSDQASACCANTDICLDNNLCLGQNGSQSISRGSCTDQTWHSSECPQYCQDVRPSWGVNIDPFLSDSSFCCGPGNSTSNACTNSVQGSTDPFYVRAGRVIFNRTSGSTGPNRSEIVTITTTTSVFALPSSSMVTVTVTSTAASSTIVANPSDPTTCHGSPSSSEKSTAIGFGVGTPLGLALLGAFGLIWRQRSRELGARKEAHNWEQKARAWQEKYDELMKENREVSTSAEGEMYELGHEGWMGRAEIHGRLVF